ncbi:MAG TPA: serine/threonine-protein kinase, partial [Minicystis sp.]|nr:serine/threonine-protein kinase [Minicystis sp.]
MAAPVSEGQVLGGKFRVERVLGTGGMGVVVAAFHLQLEQRVALKFLLPEAAKEEQVVQRFAREARAAAKIQSEHVARVLDVGTLDTGAPYMVMEYLEGRDLDDAIKADGPLPVQVAVGYLMQACEAVAEAHALGIVHRDLKPANLFVAERADGKRSIKVLDFGISKVLPHAQASAEPSLTATSAIMGSPMYMSPEQLRSSRDVDVRADIWALGIVLYEMLTGANPFESGTVAEVCASILKDKPKPLSALRDDVPDGLEAVILRCIEKDPDKRYANVAELTVALLSFGPPGCEHSIERVSSVLRNVSLRSAQVARAGTPASRPPPAPAAVAASGDGDRLTAAEVPVAKGAVAGSDRAALELAATKASHGPASPA